MEKQEEIILSSVLEVINTANKSNDMGEVRRKVIDLFYSTISADGVVFFLPDRKKLSTHVLLKNHDEKYIQPYLTHYHRYDPIKLNRMTHGPSQINLLQNIENYDHFQSTAYYTDFLRPQKIHYKLTVNLEIEGSIEGRIALTRSKEASPFNGDDIRKAQLLSPYMAHCLFHSRMRRRLKLLESTIEWLEADSANALIILDSGLNVLHMNKKAQTYLMELNALDSGCLDRNMIRPGLLEDCRAIQVKLANLPEGGILLPLQRVIKGAHKHRYRIRSKIFRPVSEWDETPLFMISIEALAEENCTQWQQVMASFQLSPREIEVVPHLFSGFTNAEIAEKLFVSEITVKKHLQNIYGKMGVRNRTSLINKVLTLKSSVPLPV